MNREKLAAALSAEPAYRRRQAFAAVYHKLIADWAEATDLPAALRARLAAECPLAVKAAAIASLKGGARKALITLADGEKTETVLMRHAGGRRTVCVSAQIGCALGCAICATGKMGFRRDLSADEIILQALYWARTLKKNNERVTNIVFMGMGEPFLNYNNVIKAIRTMNDSEGLNIGARHISISTAGLPEGIRKLAGEKTQINLAVSLHAPDDDLRSRLMPINKKYPLRALMAAVQYYIKRTKRRVMFEYALIKDVNDRPEAARKAAELLSGLPRRNYFVNLMLYNPTLVFQPATARRSAEFKAVLESCGVPVVERFRFGRDIGGACGQLRAD